MFFRRVGNSLSPLAAAGEWGVSFQELRVRESLVLYPLAMCLGLSVCQTVTWVVLLFHLLMNVRVNLTLKHLCKAFIIPLSIIFILASLHYHAWDHWVTCSFEVNFFLGCFYRVTTSWNLFRKDFEHKHLCMSGLRLCRSFNTSSLWGRGCSTRSYWVFFSSFWIGS